MQASFIESSYTNQSISTTLQKNTNLLKFQKKQENRNSCYDATVSSCKSRCQHVQTDKYVQQKWKKQINLFTISDSKVRSFKALNQFLNSSMVKILKHLKFKIYADLCSSYMWGHAKKMESISQQKWFNDELLDPLFVLLTDY